MDILDEKTEELVNMLKNEPREPFSVTLNLNLKSEDQTTEKIFKKIKDIYCTGLIVLSGDPIEKKTLEIENVNNNHIDLMKKHMLSMGIDVIHKKYSKNDIDFLYRGLLFDLQHIENIDLKVLTDWRTNLIEKIDIQMKKVSSEILQEFRAIVLRNYQANHFLKFTKPQKMRDYSIIVKKKNEEIVHVFYFDFAKRVDSLNKKLLAGLLL